MSDVKIDRGVQRDAISPSRKLKVLELFSGTECLSDAFRARGHECFTVDWDEKFHSDLHIDIESLTSDEILDKFGRPDVIFVGTDCSTFSVAAISKHRRKNVEQVLLIQLVIKLKNAMLQIFTSKN